VGIWTGLGWPRIGTVADACECGNEPSGSVKCGGCLDYLQKQFASQEGHCTMQ